jgi:hypothetical protein
MHAPMVWPVGTSAADQLNRICIINNTRWRFDEEGTFIYEQDDFEDPVAEFTDENMETIDYQFSTFEFLNMVEARGGADNTIVGTAAYPEGVVNDGLRYELIEDSGFKDNMEALRKAKGRLFESMQDLEGGTVIPYLPRLDIKPRDIIFVDLKEGMLKKNLYVSETSKMFSIADKKASTEFTVKSKETQLFNDMAEYYNAGVLGTDVNAK